MQIILHIYFEEFNLQLASTTIIHNAKHCWWLMLIAAINRDPLQSHALLLLCCCYCIADWHLLTRKIKWKNLNKREETICYVTTCKEKLLNESACKCSFKKLPFHETWATLNDGFWPQNSPKKAQIHCQNYQKNHFNTQKYTKHLRFIHCIL